jgi:hypothetical protein
LSNQLSKNEYSTVHGNFTTESAIELAASRQAEEATSTNPATVASDKHDVECYGLALAGITTLPPGLSCANPPTGGNYKVLLDLLDGNDGDVPLPQAWDAAYKASHSTLFYSTSDYQNVLAQYDTWVSLATAQLAVISEALGADESNNTDQLTDIVNEYAKVICDNANITCPAGVTIGALSAYAPPIFPPKVFLQLANGTMWVLGTSDGQNASTDTYSGWTKTVSDINSYLTANPFQTLDAATGQSVSVALDGLGLPSKAQVNALFGSWSGTTPGQWLDGQTGLVDHTLLGGWDKKKIWTSQLANCTDPTKSYDCPPSDSLLYVWKLDSGKFVYKALGYGYYALFVRTIGSGETWVPLNW